MDHMQVCISLQTDNHASTPPLSFLQAGCPSCHPTNSIKALKAKASSENTKSTKTFGGWWNPLGEPTGPVAGPSPLSALRASSFSPLGRSNWGPPSYCWTRAHQSLTTLLPKPLIRDNIFSKRNQHMALTVIHNHLKMYYCHYPSGMLED